MTYRQREMNGVQFNIEECVQLYYYISTSLGFTVFFLLNDYLVLWPALVYTHHVHVGARKRALFRSSSNRQLYAM